MPNPDQLLPIQTPEQTVSISIQLPRRIETDEKTLDILTLDQFQHFFRRVILGRHGQTLLNELGVLQGSRNEPLSEKGRAEMTAQSKYFSQVVDDIGCVISSEMSRATQTAEIFSGDLEIPRLELPELAEFNYGNWEGRPVKELLADEVNDHWTRARLSQEKNGTPHGGEPFFAFLQRVNRAIKHIHGLTLESPYAVDKRILIISHAEVSRAIRFLYILSKDAGHLLNESKITEHEVRFSFSDDGVFIKIPHGIFRIDEQMNLLSDIF